MHDDDQHSGGIHAVMRGTAKVLPDTAGEQQRTSNTRTGYPRGWALIISQPTR